jgi:hypothetical protein
LTSVLDPRLIPAARKLTDGYRMRDLNQLGVMLTEAAACW